MTYAVHHLDGQGAVQMEEFPSLESGLARVEALRNDGAVSEVRVFKEIPIEVRAYYRAVAVEADAAPEPPLPVSPPEPELEAALPPSGEEPAAAAKDELWDHAPAADGSRADEYRHVAQEPPSGAMVMGPTPVTVPRDASEPPPEPAPEHRRSLFGRG
ncbi:MAG: hypothetical protein EA387_16055 [Nitriliruptor sp.]|nr:MAG: hypothetical protein EA387_16055 [Nitriliruptor sp.]